MLKDGDLTAGDFVRWCKQVVDLLGQVEQGAAAAAALGDPAAARLRDVAREAVDNVRRGVVAYSSVA